MRDMFCVQQHYRAHTVFLQGKGKIAMSQSTNMFLALGIFTSNELENMQRNRS